MPNYYRVSERSFPNGRPRTIRTGLYQGLFELHLTQQSIDDPTAIPAMVDGEIDWTQRMRRSVFGQGSRVVVQLAQKTTYYRVVNDYGCTDSHCLILKLDKDQS